MDAAERGRRAVVVVYAAALFMSTIDLTIVNVALPSIGRDLGAPSEGLGAVSTVYFVTTAAVVGTAAWVRGRVGPRAALLGPVALFTVASALCGAAPTFLTLVLARALQGIGGGLLVPIGLGLLYELHPPEHRIRVTASTSLIAGLAPILGPTLGGLLVSTFSWRAVFLVNIPLGAAALVLGLARMPRPRRPTDRVRFDGLGFALIAGGLASLVLGLSIGPDARWTGVAPAGTTAAGILLLALFVIRTARRREGGILRLDLLRSRPLAVGLMVVLFANAAFFGSLYLIALHLQEDLRLPPSTAGAAMLLEAVPGLIGTQLTSRVLLGRFRAPAVSLVGLIGLAAALGLMSAAGADPATFLPLLPLLGLSWSLAFVPITLSANEEMTGPDTAHAATLLSSVRPVASACGIALAASLLGGAEPGGRTAAPFVALSVAAAVAAVVLVLGLRPGRRGVAFP